LTKSNLGKYQESFNSLFFLNPVIPAKTERNNIIGTTNFHSGQEKKAQIARPRANPLTQK
jgi:hypothetical protein